MFNNFWSPSYKTFYDRNLQILFYYARVFVPDKSFQPSLMFAGKAGAYPRTGTNTLAYNENP